MAVQNIHAARIRPIYVDESGPRQAIVGVSAFVMEQDLGLYANIVGTSTFVGDLDDHHSGKIRATIANSSSLTATLSTGGAHPQPIFMSF